MKDVSIKNRLELLLQSRMMQLPNNMNRIDSSIKIPLPSIQEENKPKPPTLTQEQNNKNNINEPKVIQKRKPEKSIFMGYGGNNLLNNNFKNINSSTNNNVEKIDSSTNKNFKKIGSTINNNFIDSKKDNVKKIVAKLNEENMGRKSLPVKSNISGDYNKIIDTNPMLIFSIFNQNTLMKWQTALYRKTVNKISTNENNILAVKRQNTDIGKVIKNDVFRTRVRESQHLDNYYDTLEKLIIYYCDVTQTEYKQGLNEIAAAFFLLKIKLNIPLDEILNLIRAFINKFLTNYYFEPELYAIKSSMRLVSVLLKYHEPEIYNKFYSLSIIPEMYAMSWLMTAFANKLRLDLLYYFWDILIEINDNLLLHFCFIALIMSKKDSFLKVDNSLVVIQLSNLAINSTKEIDNIIHEAIELRHKTPYSFRLLSNYLQIFKYQSTEIEERYKELNPQNLIAMPIFPMELFYITYKDTIICPDEQCPTNSYLNEDESFIIDNNKFPYQCERCEMKISKNINYIFFDLRILRFGSFENLDEKTGFLPNTIMIEQEELKKSDFAEKVINRFSSDKGKFHFIFLTSKTDYFEKFEDNFYKEHELTLEEKKLSLRGLSQKKYERELDLKSAKTVKAKELYKLQEYDNLKKIIDTLAKDNYPYISYVYGGFDEVHEKSFKYEISLLSHDDLNCYLCKELKNRKKQKVEKGLNNAIKNPKKEQQYLEEEYKERDSRISFQCSLLGKRVKINEISKTLAQIDNNLFFGILKEYKGKINENNEQIIIAINFDEIVLYNFESNVGKEGKEEIELVELENILFVNVCSITQKNVDKKLICINYTGEMENDEEEGRKSKFLKVIVIDLFLEKETRKFILCYNYLLKQINKKKNKI